MCPGAETVLVPGLMWIAISAGTRPQSKLLAFSAARTWARAFGVPPSIV